jgi:hypothetical protein
MPYRRAGGTGQDTGGKAESVRRLKLSAAGCLALVLSGGLQGCASDPNYPSLAKIAGLDNAMAPEERQKAIQDLQKNDPGASAQPAKSAQ